MEFIKPEDNKYNTYFTQLERMLDVQDAPLHKVEDVAIIKDWGDEKSKR